MLSLSIDTKRFLTAAVRVLSPRDLSPVLPVTQPVRPLTPPSPGVTETARLPADRWSSPMEEGYAPRSVFVKVGGQ